jgi:hypothetical protein
MARYFIPKSKRCYHWSAWRKAVQRTGYNSALKHAAFIIEQLDTMTPEQVEQAFKLAEEGLLP